MVFINIYNYGNKGDDLLFLFGAGASVDAGIPMSNAMVQRIEELIVQHEDWKPYRDLYYYLKVVLTIQMAY